MKGDRISYHESVRRLYEKIKSLGYEIHQIGDCLEPRTATVAIYESAVLGRKI